MAHGRQKKRKSLWTSILSSFSGLNIGQLESQSIHHPPLPHPLCTTISAAASPTTTPNQALTSKSTLDVPHFDLISRITTDTQILGSLPHPAHAQDLTQHITVLNPHTVAWGGCSDIYYGKWCQWWVKEDVRHTKAVAFKVPRPSKGRRDLVRIRERLDHEVRILLRLGHPNVVGLLGTALVLGDERAMVLPWYKNGTLVSYANNRSVRCRLRLIKESCAGVKYLHGLEPPIVHGDLKGENILVDDEGHAIVNDFGLSKDSLGPDRNTAGGSLRWLAPELLFDEDGDEGGSRGEEPTLSVASDMWAFGCMVYEILLGQLPYYNQELKWEIIQEIMRGVGPLRPEDTLIYESTALLHLLQECWLPRPSGRPPITEVASRLDLVLL